MLGLIKDYSYRLELGDLLQTRILEMITKIAEAPYFTDYEIKDNSEIITTFFRLELETHDFRKNKIAYIELKQVSDVVKKNNAISK